MSFGSSGTTEITNISSLLVVHHTVPDGNTAVWDAGQTAYVFNDLTLAQYIGTNVDESCFWVEQLPDQLFLFNFASIDTGVKA